MVAMAFSAQIRLSPRAATSSFPVQRSTGKSPLFARPGTHGWTLRTPRLSTICYSSSDRRNLCGDSRFTIEANANPPIMPAVMTPEGPVDLPSVLLRNRIIFIGQPIYSDMAQRVISQLLTLAAIDENADIMLYLNCPGGTPYSVMAVYDCMSWIKPKVGTVSFGATVSHAALILAGGEKGMRYAMPNARIMIHQPQSACEGNSMEVNRQINESAQTRLKIDKMYAAFTGQPLDTVQMYTDRDRFFTPAEAMDFGLIDGIMETRF